MWSAAHRRMRHHVEAYVDGELRSPVRAAEVRAHVDDCWGCSGDAEALRLIKRSLHRLACCQPTDLAAARLRRWAGGAVR